MKNSYSGVIAGSFMAIFSFLLVVGFPFMMTLIILKIKDDKKFNALTENLRQDCKLWTIGNLFKTLLILAILVYLVDYPSL